MANRFTSSGHNAVEGCRNCQHLQASQTGGGGWCLQPSNFIDQSPACPEGVKPSVTPWGFCDLWQLKED